MTGTIENEVKLLADIYYEEGEKTEFGCNENEIEAMKAFNRSLTPHKPCCIVKDWCIWDVQLSQSNQPTSIVKADCIIEDEQKRFPVGGWVRSTAVREIYKKCIFRTGSTSYILVGSGTRKPVDAESVVRFV